MRTSFSVLLIIIPGSRLTKNFIFKGRSLIIIIIPCDFEIKRGRIFIAKVSMNVASSQNQSSNRHVNGVSILKGGGGARLVRNLD